MILREILVKLGLDVDAQSFAKGELAAKAVEKGLEKIVDVAAELVRGFAENIKESIEYGNRLEKTSQSIGIATDALQELQYAAQLSDISAEDMSTAMGHLARNMQKAKDGSEQAGKAFKGIEYKDANGKLKSLDDTFATIAEKFSEMPDGAEKTALSMELFGRAGKQLIPLLNQGADGIDELREEAQNLGLVMNEDAIKASEELNDNLERLKMVTQGLWRQAISPLLPAINDLVKRFLEWRKANGAILAQKIREYIGYLIKGIGVLGDVFSFLAKNIKAVEILLGMAGLTAVMIHFGEVSLATAGKTALAWLAAAAPFIAIAAAIAAILLIYDDLRQYNKDQDNHSKKQHSAYGKFKEQIDEIYKGRAKPPFLQHFIDFVEELRNAGKWLTSFKRDWEEMIDLLADGFQKLAATAQVSIGLATGDMKQVQAGINSYSQVQERHKVAVAGNNRGFQGFGGVTQMQRNVSAANQRADIMASPYATDSPEYRAAGGAVNWQIQGVSTQVGPIVQQAGEDSEAFAKRVGQIVSDHWDGKMEEASSGAGN